MPKHGHKRGWRRFKARSKAQMLRRLSVMAKVLWDRIEVRKDIKPFGEAFKELRQHA